MTAETLQQQSFVVGKKLNQHRMLRIESQSRIVSNEEKFCYAQGGHLPMVLFGLLSTILLLVGLSRFAMIEAVLYVAVPFLAINGLYLLLSYSVMLSGRSFRLKDHQRLLDKWTALHSGLGEVHIDVFLPVCGEPLETLLVTWKGVQELQWPGRITVSVLDDSPTDALRPIAESHGFEYLRREDRTMRKAGNLRHAFARTTGDFILLLDADFRPRPEMLKELLPYLLEDEQLGLVQSPQFFDVDEKMNWVQAGAGFVQELFYRLIQPARDRFGASVCVGSCAVYRRAALSELEGTPAIDHSEDLWTGFELLHRGWTMKYVPIVLAKGLCPDRLATFHSQQYRWCFGSLSLVLSPRFWTSRLNIFQKLCFIAGFVYYLATAMNCILTLLPLLVMVCLFPHWVHWNHLAYSILAIIYTPIILCWWSVFPWGLHFLTTREVSGAAHLNAIIDGLLGRMNEWVVTGNKSSGASPSRNRWALYCLLGSSAAGAVTIWVCSAFAITRVPERWIHFVPPLLFSAMHLVVCFRSLQGLAMTSVSSWSFSGAMITRSYRNSAGSVEREVSWPRLASGLLMLLVVPSLLIPIFFASFPKSHWLQLTSAASESRRLPSVLSDPLAHQFSTEVDCDFGPYIVQDAFPGIQPQRVMRLREHPRQAGIYYIADYRGVISEIRRGQSGWLMKPVADLRETDLGFLYSFEIHPDFPADPRFLLAYHTERDGQPVSMRISSLQISLDRIAGYQDETILIEQRVQSSEHLAGDLAFDDENCLLISCGDNQWSLHDRRSQLLNGGLFSGILRIDIDQRGGEFSHRPIRQPDAAYTQNYFIPNDNPFVGEPGVLEEFWALGLRNPFRMSFDQDQKKLWIGEVGQDRMEQVEVATSGTNHQWSFREGSLPFSQSYLNGKQPLKTYGIPTGPIHEYEHEDLNTCVIGGVIYHGNLFPELRGHYIYGDNRSGRIWSIDPSHPAERTLIVQLPFGKSSMSLVSINEDSAGEIYFTNFVSVPSIYRLVRSRPMSFPDRLSESGLFLNINVSSAKTEKAELLNSPRRSNISLVPASGFISYDVTVPLWSDGMQKTRWFRLPPGKKIDNRGPQWKFPAGTLFVKHFEEGKDFKTAGKPVETRVLVVRDDGTTTGATYRWNAEGTDAERQLERRSISVVGPEGEFDYRLPGSRDCRVCHNRDNPVLGISEEQLNHKMRFSGQSRNRLLQLSDQGVFIKPYSSRQLEECRKLTRMDDHRATLGDRARSYLHANCRFCHHSEGLEHIKMNLDLFDTDGGSDLAWQPSLLSYHRIDGGYAKMLIMPGSPIESAIYLRLRTKDQRFSMPYLGRTRPDQSAIELVEEWIRSMHR